MTRWELRRPCCNRLKASVLLVGKKVGMDMRCMTEQLVLARVAPLFLLLSTSIEQSR